MSSAQEREVLEALWLKSGKKLPKRVWNNIHDYWFWEGDDETLRFTAMLDAGAYLDAAMMLVPESWQEWQVGRQPWKGEHALCYVLDRGKMREPLLVHAETPALALAAAIAKAGEP